MERQRTARYTFSFSLNEKTEKDMIDKLNALNGVVSIAQFVKICISHYDYDLRELLDSEGLQGEELEEEYLNQTLTEVKYYLEQHK